MLFFIIEMIIYTLTLVGALSVIPLGLLQITDLGMTGILLVLLLTPFACWGIGYLHWIAYARVKSASIKFVASLLSSEKPFSVSMNLSLYLNPNNFVLVGLFSLDQDQLFEGTNSDVLYC